MELLLVLNIGIKHGYSCINDRQVLSRANINALKNNVVTFNKLYTPKCMISMDLYFVTVSHSAGGWTPSLIFVFHVQSIYKSDKQISCCKMEWL